MADPENDILGVTILSPEGNYTTSRNRVIPVVEAFFRKGRPAGSLEEEWFICGKNPVDGKPVVIPTSIVFLMGDYDPNSPVAQGRFMDNAVDTPISEDTKSAYNRPEIGILTAFNDVQAYYIDGINILEDPNATTEEKLTNIKKVLERIGEITCLVLPG